MRRPSLAFEEVEDISDESLTKIARSLSDVNKKISDYGISIRIGHYAVLGFLSRDNGRNEYAELTFKEKLGDPAFRRIREKTHRSERKYLSDCRDLATVYQRRASNGLESVIFLDTPPEKQIDISDTSFPNLFELPECTEEEECLTEE